MILKKDRREESTFWQEEQNDFRKSFGNDASDIVDIYISLVV